MMQLGLVSHSFEEYEPVFDVWMGSKDKLGVVLPNIGDNLAYKHGLHFCQEVYPYRN
jgi:hypothetical protein